jgi:hypothetical protein
MEPYNLQELAAWLNKTGLMQKSFSDMNRAEINDFCEQVHLSTEVPPDYTPPYINDNGDLIIPCHVPGKYKWWKGGQSIKETLKEIGAPEEIKRRYLDQKIGGRKI